MVRRKDKMEQSHIRRRLPTSIFQTIIYTIYLKQILYTALIINIAMAIKTDVNYGKCKNVSSDELVPVTVIEPIHYKLLLNLNMEYEMYGESNITVNIHKPIVKLSLHCFGLYINTDSISLHSINNVTNRSTKYVSTCYRFCTETQILDIIFGEIISPGLYNLHIYFNSMYNKHENIIRHQYISYTQTYKTWFLGILSTSNRARTVFPCWDDPEIYMKYEIIIRHSEQYQVISNMPVQKLLHESNNMLLTHFHPTKPIASSQVAVIMFNNMLQHALYEEYLWYQRHMVGETKISQEIFGTKYFLAKHLSVDSRIMKTDHIIIPNHSYQVIGTLGVITYREQSLKYDNTDFPGRKINIYKIVGDALAREVLAEVICPSCFWLIKILASFLSHFVIFEDKSYSSFMDLAIVQTMQGALYYDVDFQMAPVSQNKFLFPTDEIDAIHYSRSYYNKGAALMRMLFHSLEKPEYFYKGFQKCVEKCESTSAFICDLWTIVQSVSTSNKQKPYNITEIMDTWITKRHFPELKVYRDYGSRTASISAYNCNETKWKIPITYFTISNFTSMYVTSKMILFDCSRKIYLREFNLNDFIIFNLKQTGYYRVNYDSVSWGIISIYLTFHNYNQIDVANRAQLIDDAYYFVINGKLGISEFLRLIEYLKRERNYVAWYPMFNILMYMSKYFELPESVRFKSFVLEILDSLLQKVGYEELTEDNDMTKSLRLLGLKWACKLGHKLCKTTATSKLIHYFENSFRVNTVLNEELLPGVHISDICYRILPWWKEWVYCAGMMEADLNLGFKVFFEDYGFFDQKRLMYLTCSEDERVLVVYLDNFWNLQLENLKISYRICTDPEEGYEMIIVVYRSFVKMHARKNAMLMHILENYDKLPSTILGSESPVTVLGITILELYSEDNFKQITAFVKSHRNLTEVEKSKIEIFVKYRKTELEKISHNFRMF